MRVINVTSDDNKSPNASYTTIHISQVTKRLVQRSNAIILSIDEALLHSPELNNVLKMLTQRKSHRFRCYIYPKDREPQEFWEWLLAHTNENKPNYSKDWAAFSDIYHLDEHRIANKSDLEHALSTLKQEYSNERKYAFYSIVTACLQLSLSVLCQILQIVAIFTFSLSVLFNLLFRQHGDFLAKKLPYITDLISPYSAYWGYLALLGGWTLMIISYSYMFLYMRNGIQMANANLMQYSRNKYDPFKAYSGMLVYLLGFQIFNQYNFGVWLLWLLIAFMIDAQRRQKYTALKKFTALNINKDICCKTTSEAQKLITQSDIEKLSVALRYPYRIKGVPNVFFSYTHGSEWARNLVEDLSRKMVQYHGNIFVDKHNIALGSNWRDTLHKRMGETTHILCFADSISVCSDYVAAELEAAFRLRYRTNTPRIIIIAHNDLDINTLPNAKPIFKEIFKREYDYRSPVIIIREGGGLPEAFSASFGEPDVQCSISPKGIQEKVGIITRMIGFSFKKLVYLCGAAIGIICLAQYAAGATNISVAYPFYKIVVPSFEMSGFTLPSFVVLLLSFFTVFTAIDLWNDLFRIYNVDKFLSKFGVLLRFLVVIFGCALIIRVAPTISAELWLGIVLCGFLGLSLSEDVVVCETQLFKTHRMRAESTDRYDVKYIKINAGMQDKIAKCYKMLPEINMRFRNLLQYSDYPNLLDAVGKFADNAEMNKLYKETSELLHDISANCAIWTIGDILEILGRICYCLGKYEEAIKCFEQQIVYEEANDIRYPIYKQPDILKSQLLIVIAYMNSHQKVQARIARERLIKKCEAQIAIAEKWLSKDNSMENSLSTQWRERAQSTLQELSTIKI